MLIVFSIFIQFVLLISAGNNNKFDFTKIYKNPLSNGFGEEISWVKWEDAIETALSDNKPIFLLIHKSWCHACVALKKSFQKSPARTALGYLSKYFVMVNTPDGEEPSEEEYKPDGNYSPRLLFLDRNGDTLTQFFNKKADSEKYKYYYSNPVDIVNTMKEVLHYFGVDVPYVRKGDKLKPVKPPKYEHEETQKMDNTNSIKNDEINKKKVFEQNKDVKKNKESVKIDL